MPGQLVPMRIGDVEVLVQTIPVPGTEQTSTRDAGQRVLDAFDRAHDVIIGAATSTIEVISKQSLTIREELGDRTTIASTYSNLGDLSAKRDQLSEGTTWHIRSLLLRVEIQVPDAVRNVRGLAELRRRTEPAVFVDAAATILDENGIAELMRVIDEFEERHPEES